MKTIEARRKHTIWLLLTLQDSGACGFVQGPSRIIDATAGSPCERKQSGQAGQDSHHAGSIPGAPQFCRYGKNWA
ncbi:hypothetical protein DPMN_063534 [Dreissena polymorpha]|uniref:Secreted protein n=1 Tax=Dreissena polymorpha TaxID=45954 RepID=A0A9D4HJ75_DREPO|nr:hypothetical protein DPMN_063534 [Dreissena polymorpha]